jgi:hypothetical protein
MKAARGHCHGTTTPRHNGWPLPTQHPKPSREKHKHMQDIMNLTIDRYNPGDPLTAPRTPEMEVDRQVAITATTTGKLRPQTHDTGQTTTRMSAWSIHAQC